MIAIYHILKAIGLQQSLLSLVLVYSGGAGLQYYIVKGCFDTISRYLDEAAMLDGATKNNIFWKITVPMSKLIITYTVFMTLMGGCDKKEVTLLNDSYRNYYEYLEAPSMIVMNMVWVILKVLLKSWTI